jgi:large subunit ribosomal protein L21
MGILFAHRVDGIPRFPREGFHRGFPPKDIVYAIISDRSRQITVREGDVIQCDHQDNLEPGAKLTFDNVLLVSNEGKVTIGTPQVEGASVSAEVIGPTKGPKLVVFRFKRRKNVRVKRGHRQAYLAVRITGINA